LQRSSERIEQFAGLPRIFDVSCEKTNATRRDVGDQLSRAGVNFRPTNAYEEKLTDLLFKWKFVKLVWRGLNSVTSINTGDVGDSALNVIL